jgi:hypothetical protein
MPRLPGSIAKRSSLSRWIHSSGAALALGLVCLGVGCASREAAPITTPPGTSRPADPAASAGAIWPFPPAQLEAFFADDEFEILSAESAGAGVTGALKAEIRFPRFDQALKVKWKRMPSPRLDGMNNSPRKEMAVYEIQKWFLEPVDYVVPTLGARCIPVEIARRYRPEAVPTLPGTNCVMGVAAAWLDQVILPDVVMDDARFARDNNYAYHLANFNLLTYLVRHRDGRSGNFLVSKNEEDRRIFAVDNGIAFGGLVYNYFVPNWDRIRVPALRRESVDELRQVDRARIEQLGIVANFELGPDGVMHLKPASSNLDPSQGVRIQADKVQMGLTADEIDLVERRIRDLLQSVDSGEIAVF